MKNYVIQTSDKNKRTALLLCLFGGFFGLHQFYVGRIKQGILYLFTVGLFCIGWFVDILMILTGSFKDNVGAPLRTTHNKESSNGQISKPFVELAQHSPIQINDNAILITDEFHNIEYMTIHSKVNEDFCLISSGGKTYHTHVGCFKNWPEEYQANFKGWKKISVADADNLGYRKCNFCDEKDKPSVDTYEDPWDTYENEKPVKTFSVTVPDEFASTSDYNIGEEVNEDYDYEKDKTVLEINYESINMPKSARDFFEENTDSYRMFILDVNETDSGKVKLKIGIFEEI